MRLWSLILLYNIETIPNLNASDAFKVDSGKVFKEDMDIVPIIIDETLFYVPWSGNNAMAYDILKLIEGDETLATCQMFNAEGTKVVQFILTLWSCISGFHGFFG